MKSRTKGAEKIKRDERKKRPKSIRRPPRLYKCINEMIGSHTTEL